MNILLTGGLGFIGSHVAVLLGETDHKIIIIDNLSNSSYDILLKIKKLVKYPTHIKFIQGDVTNKEDVEKILCRYK